MCNCVYRDPRKIMWGCPAPLAESHFNLNNPPYMRPVTNNQCASCDYEKYFRIQTEAVRQPTRPPTLAPWQGQAIPPRAQAQIIYSSW